MIRSTYNLAHLIREAKKNKEIRLLEAIIIVAEFLIKGEKKCSLQDSDMHTG